MSILHAKVMGEGFPLIVLHGLFGSSDNWLTLGKKFSSFFQVHLIDLRNHGRSFHDDQMTYALMVADVRKYLADNKLDEAYVMGHSMGGKVAMKLALEHAEQVRKLIVIDIAPKHYPAHHQHIIKALKVLDFEMLNNRSAVERVLSEYITEHAVKQFLLKNVYWVSDKQLGLRFNVQALEIHYEELMEDQLEGKFHHPTLFLAGENSHYIEQEDFTRIKDLFPKASICTVPRTGHWIHAENPTFFYDTVQAFLSEVKN